MMHQLMHVLMMMHELMMHAPWDHASSAHGINALADAAPHEDAASASGINAWDECTS